MPDPRACKMCGRSFVQRERGGRHSYCKRCRARADMEVARKLRVKCKECGKAFATTSRAVRYCSDECRAESARRYGREYQRKAMADPERRAIHMVRVRASGAARRARERGGMPPQRQPPMRSDPNAEPSICRLCGRSFEQRERGGRHSYCERCRARAAMEVARKLRVKCRECGKAFSAAIRSARYCSDECRASGKRRINRESRRRRMADPEKRAIGAAHVRAWNAAHAGGESRG